MDLNKSYIKTDATLEKDGVEVELDDGAVIIVRPIRNADFKRYLNELQKPYDLTRKAVAKHVLIGWKGIELDGKPVKYSPKVAEELMIEFDEFQDDVLSAATARETFREEIVEENEKNS